MTKLVIRPDEVLPPAASDSPIEVTVAPSVFHDGRRYPITGQLRLGSDASADLRLDPAIAADEHAVVSAEPGGGLTVAELSGVGLLLNGEAIRMDARPLRGGDRLTIGGEHLTIADGTENPTAALQRGPTAEMTIGSDPRAEIVLAHPAVSPIHAVLSPAPGGAVIHDRSHGGGLTVDGRVVGSCFLRPGAELGIGPFRLVFDGSSVVARAQEGVRVAAYGVSRRIGRREILKPTTLTIRPGEFVAIIGESGAGKSTLLRLLAAVDECDSGSVSLAGEPIATRRMEIGYVPQDEIVHAELTVEEALWFAARLRLPDDTPDERIAEVVVTILDELDLSEHLETRVGDLSGGQRKRVGLATELVSRPSVLLLDEATTGLDPALERKAMRLFRRLASGARSVALVTHATRSLDLCDRVMVLAPGGETCFYGSPGEALRFFGVKDFDEIYPAISARPSAEWNVAFERCDERLHERRQAKLETAAGDRRSHHPRKSRSVLRQVGTLFSRYTRVFVRDRRNLALLLAQAPLLGLLAALIFKPGALADPDRARDATNLIFLLTTISVWLGAVSAAREVVRERALAARERAIGVGIGAYLTSKVLLLGVLGTVQVATMALCAFALQPPDVPADQIAGLLGCLLLAAWTAITLGLAISSYASSENQATSFIPLALIPQLLLGGAIVAVAVMSSVMQVAADLTFTRWFFAGAGSAFDLDSRIADDPNFERVSDYGETFFQLPGAAAPLIAVAFSVVFLFSAWIAIERRGFGAASRGRSS